VLPRPDSNIAATAELSARLGGAVIMGHSQTGLLPLYAMLANPTAVKGLILLEPAACQANQLTEEQVATLTTVPILTVFGDHLDAVTGTMVSWQAAYNDCQALVDRLNSAGGNAEMLHPADLGIHGNSHMIMQDRNNLQIADLILQWIDRTHAAELENAT
jgi:predicted esterase